MARQDASGLLSGWAQRSLGAAPIIQAKLKVGTPNDALEREADQVAAAVTSGATPSMVHSPNPIASQVQTKCNTCKAEEEEKPRAKVQRKPISGKSPAAMVSPTAAELCSHTGSPLPAHVRSPLERAIGADFSQVRIHTGPCAAALNARLSAQAFTYQNHVFFDAGKYDPQGLQGRKLLAHELTHVVQQGAASPLGPRPANQSTGKEAGDARVPAMQAGTAQLGLLQRSPNPKPDPVAAFEVPGEMNLPAEEPPHKEACDDPSNLPRTKVKYHFTDKAHSMEAFPLTCNHEEGSPPLQGDPYWPKGRYCVAKTNTGKFWKRMHLLNEKLGGPGDHHRNIIMGSAFLNWHHWDSVENWLKVTVYAGAMVRYKVEVEHWQITGTPAQRKQRQFWPYFAGSLKITTQEFEDNDPGRPLAAHVFTITGNRVPPECDINPADPSLAKDNPQHDSTHLVIDGFDIANEAWLSVWFGQRHNDLLGVAGRLESSKLPVPKSLENLIREAHEQAELYEGGGESPLTKILEQDVLRWYANFEDAMHDGTAKVAHAANVSLAIAGQDLSDQQSKVQSEMLPELAELKRLAFRNEDEDGLEKIENDRERVLDTVRQLAGMVRDVRGNMALLHEVIRNVGGAGSLLGKLTQVAEGVKAILKIGKTVWAGFELVTTNWAAMTSAPTAASSMGKGISFTVSAYSAGATLLGATGLASFVSVYLGPVVGACLEMVHILEEWRSRTYNRPMIRLGHYNSVNWMIEPGGRPVFDFMRALMAADKPSQVPNPDATTQEFFLDQKERLDAGVEIGGVPTTEVPILAPLGMVVLSKTELDQPAFKRWALRERHEIWAMLYGSMDQD